MSLVFALSPFFDFVLKRVSRDCFLLEAAGRSPFVFWACTATDAHTKKAMSKVVLLRPQRVKAICRITDCKKMAYKELR